MLEQIKLKVCLLQISKVFGNSGENHRRVQSFITKALKQPKKPDILLLPEMWTTRWNSKGTDAIEWLRQIARENGVNIVAGSVADERPSQDTPEKTVLYNTAYIINRGGEIVAKYDQVHIPKGNDAFSSGNEVVTFELDGIPCGIIIGYDLRFPEFVRRLTLNGSKLLFVPGMWPCPIKMHWKLLNIVRAIENQVFIVAANHAGKLRDTSFPGMSMVVNPWGEIQLEGDGRPDVLTTIINVSLVDHVRNQHSVFGDRRPEVY